MKTYTIGGKIKKWRQKKQLTQESLSIRSDIPYTTLTKIENDVIKNPSMQTVIKIAKGLGISLDELVKGDDDSTVKKRR